MKKVGVRWTIGDVSREGFEALNLSLYGAWRIFRDDASYAVCVNTISVASAREMAGKVPASIKWYGVTRTVVPPPHHDPPQGRRFLNDAARLASESVLFEAKPR